MRKLLAIFASGLFAIGLVGLVAPARAGDDETAAVVYLKLPLGGPQENGRTASEPVFGFRIEAGRDRSPVLSDDWTPPLLDVEFDDDGLRAAYLVGFDTTPGFRALHLGITSGEDALDRESQDALLSLSLAGAVAAFGFVTDDELEDVSQASSDLPAEE